MSDGRARSLLAGPPQAQPSSLRALLELLKRVGILLFGLWLGLALLVLLLAAVAEKRSLDILGYLSVAAYIAGFALFWRWRWTLAQKLPSRQPTLGGFLLTGWVAAMLAELLLYFTHSYQQEIGLLLDFTYTSPMYLGLLLAWWLFLKRYPLSHREVFFLAGIHGWLIELPQKLMSGNSALQILIGTPGHIFIYGAILLVPVALFDLASTGPRTSLPKKYLFGLGVMPLLLVPAYLLAVVVLAVGRSL
jgi:hypothetical protein